MTSSIGTAAYGLLSRAAAKLAPSDGLPIPVVLSRLGGNPINSRPVSGTGNAVGDVLVQLDTIDSASVIARFTVAGTSCQVQFKGSADGGSTWAFLPQATLDRFGQGIVAGSLKTDVYTVACDTLGFPLVKLEIASISSGPCTAFGWATSRALPPHYLTRPTASANVTSGSAGVAKAAIALLRGFSILNVNAATRFLQIYDQTSAPTAGTTPLRTEPIGAGSAARVGGLAIQHKLGIAWAVTTDAAGATLGASGDLVGTIDYTG